MNRYRTFCLSSLAVLLGACQAVVLDPAGDVAVQQRDLLLSSTFLMLLIIVPVMTLTVWFAWHYRQSNRKAKYDPEWDHSIYLELIIWGAPLLIIICLGAMTWLATHLLDPYRKIGRIAPGKTMTAGLKSLEVDVVAMDWKWLFIYPEYGVATINELAAPVDRPIDFHITSATVMNSFYVPALAGQIYAMAGMETKLHAVINHVGDFKGFSANYSGAGFSGMHFIFHGLDNTDFAHWIATVKASGTALDLAAYDTLMRPTENVPVKYFGTVTPTLYASILNLCVKPGQVCMNGMPMTSPLDGDVPMPDAMPMHHDKHMDQDHAAHGTKPSAHHQ